MRALVWLIAGSLASAAALADAAEIARPEVLAKKFIESWNAHAPERFGEYLDADTDWITASGLVLRGRSEIVAYLTNEHAGWAANTTMTETRVVVREVAANTMIIRLEWQIGTAGVGGAPPAFPGVTLFVATRAADGWRVLAGQVTSGRSRAASPGAGATSETSPKRRRPSVDLQVLGSVTPR